MSEDLLNIVRREVERAINRRKHKRYGLIDGYDPSKHAVKVKFQPDGQISGWIPVGTSWSGKGWGLFTPPSPGDMVTVHYEAGDLESATVSHRYWNDEDTPLEVPAGEAWMHHKEGQGFRMRNDKTFSLHGQERTTQLFDPQGHVVTTFTGDRRAAFRKENAPLKRVVLEDGSFSNRLWATTI